MSTYADLEPDTGLFIDITTLRRNKTAGALGIDGAMMVKDKHKYRHDDIYPLRYSTFEGFPVKIPFAYSDVLLEEYGVQALTNPCKYTQASQLWMWETCADLLSAVRV